MKYVVVFFLSCLCLSCISVKADVTTTESPSTFSDSPNLAEAGIRLVLENQIKAWNKHDLKGFMEGYWKSSQLKFYGANGLTLGWENTLENYKKRYPTKAESGTLDFVIKDISKIEGNNYWVMGEYHLSREIGDADGVFIIIFKKIDDQWKIIADMSC
ncbi:YybH family protein [Winogradskyella aurantia]|uniref:DUF4440 domain-containing protein n=1 Tax=Winogradskyella aurantia TaxID=1915063 RepID=A0A265UWA0_9FLAO|nr:nuclear transport factor 2 family protein [Winogradskyella aurantia]OZV69357.1 DUF4440 domain-containing protein [Winogradskyella aurantia]